MANLVYKRKFYCERLNDAIPFDYKSIASHKDAATLLRAIYEKEGLDVSISEACIVVFINTNNLPVGYYKVSEGGLSSTTIDNRMITKAALDCFASGVLLCHNHPSGSPTPSKADVTNTERLMKCLEVFDIQLLDHIILSEQTAYSFVLKTLF